MLAQPLGTIEVRVLFSLVEKQLTTPDNYPLSANALTNACNQQSNRDPVMTLDEEAVLGAVTTLRRASFVRSFQGIGSRVPKYEHLLSDAADLSRLELAVLCVLALRGSQTLAEIRTRAARMALPDDGARVEETLESLMTRSPAALVTRLSRRPGQKEARYAHLLSGEVIEQVENGGSTPPVESTDQIAALEEAVRELRDQVTDLRAQFKAFREQFE
jgi:uncharacterized protein